MPALLSTAQRHPSFSSLAIPYSCQEIRFLWPASPQSYRFATRRSSGKWEAAYMNLRTGFTTSRQPSFHRLEESYLEEKLARLSWNVREQLISLYLQGLIAAKVTGQKLFWGRDSHNSMNLYQTSCYQFSGLHRCSSRRTRSFHFIVQTRVTATLIVCARRFDLSCMARHVAG